MKRCRKSAPAVTPAYMAAWSKLFARSPAELEAERQARNPAPAPQPPGSRKTPAKAPNLPQNERKRTWCDQYSTHPKNHHAGDMSHIHQARFMLSICKDCSR